MIQRLDWLLVAIVVLGLGLRFWNIDFGLPYTITPDEPWHLTVALRMFRNGDLNPHWLNYPSLMFYLNALAYVPFFLTGKAMGVLAVPADIPYPEIITVGVGRSLMPSQFVLGRGLTALFGAGAIVLIYLLARRLHPNRVAAWLAAFFLAISPASVFNSHLIRPDTLVVFFVLFSGWWSIRLLDDPRLSNYIWAGIGAGLALSSKYNVPFIVLPLIVAHFLRWGIAGIRRREIYVGLVASGLAFCLTTPFALLDVQQFLRDMGFEVAKQISGGHTGFEGDALRWYVEFLWSDEGVLVMAAVVEAIWLALTRSKTGWTLLSFPVTYFAFISTLIVRNDRTILPVLPFVHLLAALFIVRLYGWFVNACRVSRRLAVAVCLALSLLFAVQPLQNAMAADARLSVRDSRDAARVWIEQNLPPGARIVVEAYSPYVDPSRFTVEGVDGMIAHPPDWYVQNGFEYLVFSYGAYGRFYADAARYSDLAKQYDALFARFPEIKRFDTGGFQVRVHQTGVTALPAQRVAARFGVYAPMLELVGYDRDRARPGDALNVTLYWRTLASRREPLKLTARLRDTADREITQSSGDLFGVMNPGGRWREGITRVPWTVAVPATAAPGVYRLELDVDGEGLGRIPVLSFDKQPISDKLFIGPFKIAADPPNADELARARPVHARFADRLTLVGYSLKSRTARPGDSLEITLYWQSAARSEKDYTFFAHLLDANGIVRAQVDAQPRGGTYPTSIWDIGEIVRDDYAIALPRDLAPGEYKIEVGLYEYPSLTRLLATDADGRSVGDHLILGDTVQVVP